MSHNPLPLDTARTRRRMLQGILGGAAGLLAWHKGWPTSTERCGTAGHAKRPDDLGSARHPGAYLVGPVGDPQLRDPLYVVVLHR
jgi:hypothetical protein